MKKNKKYLRIIEKEKAKAIEKSMSIGRDNLSSNVKYLQQVLEQINELSCDSAILKNICDIEREMNKLKRDIIFLSKGININLAIPILIKLLDKIYFDSDLDYLKDKGAALKNLIAILWLYGDKNISSKTYRLDDSFICLLKKIIKYSKLVHYDWLLSVEKSELQIELSVSETDVELTPPSEDFFNNNYIFSEIAYGDGQRSTEINNNLFFANPPKYIDSINQILDGKEPKDINYLKGTYFEYFKGVNDSKYTNFWNGLKVRLDLFIDSFTQLKNNDGIFYLNISKLEQIIYQHSSDLKFKKNLMLTRDFLDGEYLHNQHKIVSRPLIPLFNEKYCFLSCYNLFDSINNYIESFIFKMNTTKTLSERDEELFKEVYSEPFENEVIKLLYDFGYKSGRVTEGGAWRVYSETDEFVEEIANDMFRNQNIGEIDCLAISESKRIIYIIECKVLQFPIDFSSYRNRITHINGKYKMQLQKKVDFVKSKYEGYIIRPVLLLDKSSTTIRQYGKNLDNLRILTVNLLKDEL